MKPETKFSAKVMKRLKWVDKTFVVRTQAGSIVGIPDLLICCNGRFFAWELKVGGNHATVIQAHTLNLIRLAKGEASVVTPQTLETSIAYMVTECGVQDDYNV